MSSDVQGAPPFHDDVVDCFGFLPNFFCSAPSAPGLMDQLWGFARSAYIDNPLPSLFKERLLVHLSRFCRIRYCVMRHVGFLIGNGRPAGDRNAPAHSLEQALALLRRPPLDDAGLEAAIARWEAQTPILRIPDPETQDEADFLDILTFIFLDPARSEHACRAVRNTVGDCNFELVVALLAFARTLHMWSETHPDLEIEEDMIACMEANPEFGRLLKNTREAEEASIAALRSRLAATEIALQETARMEKALRESEAALKEADQRKDEFIATLAHELRNPLAPILSATYVLQKRFGTADPDTRLLDAIRRQTEHLIRLVDDLFEISRVTRGTIELRKESVDLSNVVRDALESCDVILRKKEHIVSHAAGSAPYWVHGDPVRLAQIFVNLLNNAAKYTPRGGLITIETSREDGEIVCRVRDNGIGISPNDLPRVFDLFTRYDTLNMMTCGLGIGLALVRKLVEMHDGNVEARSAGIGGGSEFTVRLPAHTAPDAKAVSEELARADAKTVRVLVIEDNKDVGEIFQLLLEQMGAVVKLANNGPSGIATAQEFDPELIFVDIGMPGMDGYETARRLREGTAGRQYTLVALTGWGLEDDRRRALAAGFDVHLTKPASADVLQKLLDSVIPVQPQDDTASVQ